MFAEKDDTDALSGLTDHELGVMVSLINAWDKFTLLPSVSPDDRADFLRAIHDAQRILAGRIVSRSHPKYWR